MSNVVYLKSDEYDLFVAFNREKSSRTEVYKNEFGVSFTTCLEDDFDWSINYDLTERKFVAIDKSEFDQALNKFEATLKEIKSQL